MAAAGMAALLLAVLFIIFVDLRPRIGADFFFGSNDPELVGAQRIGEIFPADEFVILSAASDDIHNPGYGRAIQKLTDRLGNLPGITRVLSIASGPESLAAAMDSPFWRPLLISRDEQATLIIVFLDERQAVSLVPVIEQMASQSEAAGGIGRLSMSGMPYIAEQIRKNLVRDMKLFSTLALVIFAGLLWVVFRSPVVALGGAVSGISAIFATLLALHFMGQPIGILTANLAIIVFVLTQSQIIYLTNNWLRTDVSDGIARMRDAVRRTAYPAFWCGVTTFLGFMSLILVPAEPLRQLGAGGMVGVLSALGVTFLIYPAFLLYVRRPPVPPRQEREKKSRVGVLSRGGSVLLVGLVVLLAVGLPFLNTDPGLLAYFKKGGDIERGLARIDENGGSSPLQLVVSRKDGERLDTAQSYEQLWTLHHDLARHDQVGTVLSLPALMAEANNHPLAFLLPWREIVTLLSLEANQNVASSFLDPDRTQALYLLRMKEQGRDRPRAEVMQELEGVVSSAGFHLDLSGGVYMLQGRLSALVSKSLVGGVISLLGLFFLISFLLTRKGLVAGVMTLTAAIIPAITLGYYGTFRIPIDIISAPAVTVSVGLAVDALIHLVLAIRRSSKKGGAPARSIASALREQGTGIVASSGIITLGFLIFSASGFPPTIRFGLGIIMGAVIAAVASLTLFPYLLRMTQKFTGKA
ncbi:efflux RND transporter permease subunit [Sneathiella chinensis]|nr:MMPL family transporter [Sneathiella chinensis]